MRLKHILAGLLFISTVFSAEKVIIKKPPESLKKYYPPESQKFEFLSNMYKMSTAFTGINLNINEGDWEKALRWAKELRDTYIKTSKMVPEWKDYFKPELANELVKAVESKNIDRVIQASRNLGRTCAKCHQDNQLSVMIYYHFPDFDAVKIEDPVDFMEYDTGEFMKKLSNSLKALKVFLSQGDVEKAQEHGMNFIERARQLRTMCSKCHTNKLSEEVLVGKEYEGHLNRIEELLSAEKPNTEEIFKSLRFIGMTCSKCHNVHMIPQMFKEALAE